MVEIEVSLHCLNRYVERFEREVENVNEDLFQRINAELEKGHFWYDPLNDVFFVVYKHLKTYVAVLSESGLRLLTVYPYTKRTKRKLGCAYRIENPLVN
jgi:hypothetical protein